MKTKIVLVAFLVGSLFLTSGCTKSDLDLNENRETPSLITRGDVERPFYYYFGEKIYLTERTDKVLIQKKTGRFCDRRPRRSRTIVDHRDRIVPVASGCRFGIPSVSVQRERSSGTYERFYRFAETHHLLQAVTGIGGTERLYGRGRK